jgi:hypothetical protein
MSSRARCGIDLDSRRLLDGTFLTDAPAVDGNDIKR